MLRRNECRLSVCVVAGLALTGAFPGSPAWAVTKSDSKVKIKASAGKPDADGKQVVTIKLKIEKPWHIYANPLGQTDFPGVETKVTVSARQKPAKVSIEYPKGKAYKDPSGEGTIYIYEGEVTIKAVVQRAKGDTGPLDVTLKLQATGKTCLLPATVKVKVE
jgi:DsbC/DsbD-like thiol-disulfide interchange protein